MNQPTPRPARRTVDGSRSHSNDYTPAEDAALRALYPSAPRAEVLAALPTRDWKALQRAADRRGISRPRRPHNAKWEGKPIEMLRARYATEGALLLAAELGFPAAHVRSKAEAEGIIHIPRQKKRPAKKARKRTPAEEKAAREARLQKLYPNRLAAPKVAKPAAKVAKPKPAPKPVVVAPEPVKRSPATPLLNARAEQRRLADKQQEQKPKPYVTAEQIKALGANHPARWAWTKAAHAGPAAATEAYHQAMNQLKQVA